MGNMKKIIEDLKVVGLETESVAIASIIGGGANVESATTIPNLDKICKDIKGDTDINNHTEAYITISEQILKNKKLTNAFVGISFIEEYYGHLPGEAKKIASELYGKMMSEVKNKLSEEDYKKVYKST